MNGGHILLFSLTGEEAVIHSKRQHLLQLRTLVILFSPLQTPTLYAYNFSTQEHCTTQVFAYINLLR